MDIFNFSQLKLGKALDVYGIWIVDRDGLMEKSQNFIIIITAKRDLLEL